jgi:hypothetical protein
MGRRLPAIYRGLGQLIFPVIRYSYLNQFSIEMALYNRRMARDFLAAQRMEAIKASELRDGIVEGRNTVNSDSELSTVSSSRFSGLDEDWWKEKAPAAGGIQASTATVTVVKTRSRSKRVHWK